VAIHQQTAGRVLVLTLDDAATKNALGAAAVAELRDLFETVGYGDPLPPDAPAGAPVGPGQPHRPHAVVLRSAGTVFSAGAHLGEMKAMGEAGYQENLAAALDLGALFRAVRNCPAPVVAMVQGAAFGGGAGLAAACDLVVASPRAKFCFSEVKLGLVPGVISPLVIGRLGLGRARDLFLTARVVDGAEAHRLGLADRLAASPEDLEAAVEVEVNALLQAGPAALGLCKSLLEGVDSLGFARSAEVSARMIAQARSEKEAQAALAAFLAKEPAPWQGGEPWVLPPLPAGGEDT
jgi:methylglutaconyl-CoA hydratase